ncbi:proline dehydrogenase family protein [Tomitella biformata]|uniref:proline dehydrogenase family protein n=1 Tax=Tomitella biformata TaxID=630403 RepID=UPI000464F54C|nr:proline dehydrogenase family protein [Tomitella biformata]
MALFDALRPAMLAAARSPRLERTISTMPATRSLVRRFVAGETEADAALAATALLDSGRLASIDYLGEDTVDAASAADTVAHYRALLSVLPRSHGPVPKIEVSVKLSALGLGLPNGPALALENARAVCAAAEIVGAWVSVDAEGHASTDTALSVIRDLRADFPTVGTVLQAYLHRTEADCRDLSGTRVRLCKGAYAEPAAVAFQGRAAVADSYLRCLAILMRGAGYPMVASHDPSMLRAALRLASETGRPTTEYEFQMLYGIRTEEQLRLAGEGYPVRIYLPYGAQWYGYFMRRLAERPANLGFLLRALEKGHR